jgi:hypothetical protein
MPTVTTPYVTSGNRRRNSTASPYTGAPSPKLPSGTSSTVAGTSLPWYMNPSANARPDTQYSWQGVLDQSRTLSPAEQSAIQMQIRQGQAPNQAPISPLSGFRGGSGGGGGGGGGGGAAPTGLDQDTLNWLLGQMQRGKPQDLTQTMLDLPDPAQYYGNFQTGQYDTARQGITSGLQGVGQRATTAYDAAQQAMQSYINPYAGGMQQTNPNLYDSMQNMAQANGAMGQLHQSVGEGAQADRAFGNVQALMAANDQARQAANLRAIAGDRATTEQNLGIEGNMLNLGVNMAQARGQSAWDQMVRQAQLDAANTETTSNWQRGNTVGDTNVGNRNQWNQGIMQTLLQLAGAKAPGTTLAGDWGFYV